MKMRWWLLIAAGLSVASVPAVPALQAQQLGALGPGANEGRAAARDVTFAGDVVRILQENCQKCHRPDGVAPMSLMTYEEVRPWAPLIRYRTSLRDEAGAMPPYYLERGLGIQQMKDDERLTEEEIETIGAWVEAGAPLGDPADLPPPVVFAETGTWPGVLGEPDLITQTEELFMAAGAPDWWGDMPSVPVGLSEDRYVRAVAIREVNSVVRDAADDTSVGGHWIVHHMIWSTRMPELEEGEEAEEAPAGQAADAGQQTADTGQQQASGQSAEPDREEESTRTGWPVHELGRNPDIFNPRAGRLLRAGSQVVSNSVHLHSNGADTRAHLEIGWYFHSVDYEPEYRRGGFSLGDGLNIDIRGGQEEYQELHAFAVLDEHVKITSFEPHLHGPGARMCLQAIWGMQIETLNCAGYDHNWVKQYTYDDDYAPLLPKGTVVHLVGYMDMSEDSPNVPDPRNWQGSGNRSITNMFIDLGNRVRLTDEQFVAEMAARRQRLGLGVNDHVIGCPLCMANIPLLPPAAEAPDEGNSAAGAGDPAAAPPDAPAGANGVGDGP